MNRGELARIKMYLEAIADINRVVKPDLVKEWNAVYGIVYQELNGVKLVKS